MDKIVHIITGLATGGAERALFNILNGGLTNRFDNHVISLSDEGSIGPQIKSLGVPVSTLDMKNGLPSLSGIKKLRNVVRSFQPALIQGWMYHGNMAATMARKLLRNNPILVWNVRQTLYDLEHEKPLTRQVIRVCRFLSSSPDALLYNSLLSRKQHEDFGFASKRGLVIPNGIDIKKYIFSIALRERVRSEHSIPEDAQVVGHVARFHAMKDHHTFLRAAAKITLKHPNVHFLLSGSNVSLENRYLRELIPEQANDRFHLLGECREVAELMNAMDIFCLSSAWGEGFPNVLGEAMSTGVPCLATDVGDSSMIIADTGEVVPPGDENALAEGIARLLKLDPEKRSALGAKARARIEAKFTLKDIVGQYARLYENLLTIKRAV